MGTIPIARQRRNTGPEDPALTTGGGSAGWRILLALGWLLFFAAGPAGAAASAADEAPPPPMDVVLVLDNSGSMVRNDPSFLMREVVIGFLSRLERSAHVGMVIFDREARLVQPLVAIADLKARARLVNSLEAVDYRGKFSDFPAAVERALYELRDAGRKEALGAVVLITDGIVDTGDPQRDREKRDWLRNELRREAETAGIRIFGIAFTEKADFSLIQSLAANTGGDYFRTFRMEDVSGVFDAVRNALEAPAAAGTPAEASGSDADGAAEPVGPSPQPASVAPPEGSVDAPPPQGPPSPREPPPPSGPGTLPVVLLSAALTAAVVLLLAILARRRRTGPAVSGGEAIRPGTDSMPRAELVDLKNVTGTGRWALRSPVVRIGRDGSSDVVVPKNTVSSLHAVVEYRDGFFWIEDQRSRNRTLLNEEPLRPYEPKRLKNGDEIRVHDVRLRFLLPDAAPAGQTVMDFGAVLREPPPSDEDARDAPEPASRIPQAMLVDVKNVTGRKTLPVEKARTTIGRGRHNDVVIPQASVSGAHAVIEYRDGFFRLEDQRSRNGTRLNGEELDPQAPAKLKSGDELLFDAYKFIFLLASQTPVVDTNGSW